MPTRGRGASNTTLPAEEADAQTLIVLASIQTTKEELKNEFKSQISALKQEFNEALQAHDERLDAVEKKNEELQTMLDKVLERCSKQDDEIKKLKINGNDRDAHSRRNNLIFSGIAELPNETKFQTRELLEQVMVENMEIDPTVVRSFIYRDLHRLHPIKARAPNDNRPQPTSRSIIVAFIRQDDRNLVFRLASKLGNSGISVRADLPAHLMEERNNLLLLRKGIKEVDKKKLAILQYRNYKPVLIVKHRGRLVRYDQSTMDIGDLELQDETHIHETD